MTARYYGRRVALTVGRPASLPLNPVSAVQAPAVKISAGKHDQLRVSFRAEKSLKAEPNRCEIRIYNLSETTRGLLSGGQTVAVPMVLEAGYDDGEFGIIFAGTAKSIDHIKERTGYVTEIRALDGHGLQKEPVPPSFTFPKGTKVADILSGLLDFSKLTQGIDIEGAKAKLAKGQFKEALQTAVGGISLDGFVGPNLAALSKRLGMRFSVQDGEAVLLEEGDTRVLGDALGLLLSPSTGLVGVPEIVREEKIGEPQKPGSPPRTTDRELVVKAKALMTPRLFPGARVRIQSDTLTANLYASDFRVQKSTATGDTHGAQFDVEIEAQART